MFDPIEGFESVAAPARLEVQSLIREIGLIEDYADLEDDAFHAGPAVAADRSSQPRSSRPPATRKPSVL